MASPSQANYCSRDALLQLLHRFLALQEGRARIYNALHRGFAEYLENGSELGYKQLCGRIASDFNDCSKQVIEIESILRGPNHCRDDLANLIQSVQVLEKQKLHMTAQIQILKKAGRPSERVVTHERCTYDRRPLQHHCVHVHELSIADGLVDAELEAQYDNAFNEAVRGIQEAVTAINEHMEEVRYEIDELETAAESQNPLVHE